MDRHDAPALPPGHGGVARIRAKVFIDSTGEVWLARALGCETVLGVDPRSRFNEPSAPEEGSLQLNAITRCYMIVPSDAPKRQPAPETKVEFPRAAFVTGWMGENHFATLPTALYGVVLLMAGAAYILLQRTIIARHGKESVLARAVGRDIKGRLSLFLYVIAIEAAFLHTWFALAVYFGVAVMWFIPDRRIEKAMAKQIK